MTFRILITGSRTWPNPAHVWAGIELAIAEANPTDVVVVHGTARGVDEMASLFVKVHRRQFAADGIRLQEERHPADWEAPCQLTCRPGHRKPRGASDYCPAAGHYRNAVMVAAGADLCLAFIHQKSRGATMCADLAEKAGIPVRRVT